MAKNLQKMAVAAAAILGLGATSVKSAEAASVKLTFFQEGVDTAVGVGSFSYDESTPYEAIFPSLTGRDPLEIKASNKWFLVQDVAINLLGLSWNLSQPNTEVGVFERLLWLPFNGRQFITANTARLFRSGVLEPSVLPQWIFGDVQRLPSLRIVTNIEGPGSRMNWQQNGRFQSNGSLGFGQGYLIAEEVGPGGENPESVPEPATTAGLAMAAAGLGYAKKKFRASKV
jgi:hypothetical protein